MLLALRLSDIPVLVACYVLRAVNALIHPWSSYQILRQKWLKKRAKRELDRSFSMMRHPSMRNQPEYIRDEAARKHAQRIAKYYHDNNDVPT